MYKFFIVCLLGIVGCDNSNNTNKPNVASKVDIGEVIATVNGMPIGSLEYEKAAARTAPKEGDSLSSSEKLEVVDVLVDEKLLYQEALEKGLDQDPKVQKMMINTLLRQEVYGQVRNSDFDDTVLKAYYDAHPEEFLVPEKVQLKKILIRVTDDRPEAEAKKLAEEARAKIISDPKENFKDVAAQLSEDSYRRRGGDVGFISMEGKPGLDGRVVTKAFELNMGEVSEVFQTSDGFNIIYIANKRDKVERSYDQMKGSVLRKVKSEKLKELYEQYVANLRQGVNVDVNEDKLAAIEVKQAIRPTIPAGMELEPLTKEDGEDIGDGEE